MKRFILSLVLIPVLGFGIYVSAANEDNNENTIATLEVKKDTIATLEVKEDNTMSIVDGSGLGSCHLIGTEYYVFAPGKVHLVREGDVLETKLNLKDYDGKNTALFYNSPNENPKKDKHGKILTNLTIDKDIYLGMAQGKFPQVKYKIGTKTVFLCNPSYFKVDISRDILCKPNFKGEKGSLVDSVLTIERRDTLDHISITKPKYAILESCTIGNTKLKASQIGILNEEATINFSISEHWADIRNGDELKIVVKTIGDNGVFDQEVTRKYTINVIEKSKITPYLIFGVIGLVVLALIIAALIWFNKNHKPSKGKTSENTPKNNDTEKQNHNDSAVTSVPNEDKPEETVEIVTSQSEEVSQKEESQEINEPADVPEIAPKVESEPDTVSDPKPETEQVNYENKIAELEKQLKDKDQEINDLRIASKHNLDELQKKESRINEYVKEVNAKQNKIDNLTATLESKEGIIRSKDDEISNGKNQIKQQKEKIENMLNDHNQKVSDMQSDHNQQIAQMVKDHQEQVNKMRNDYTQHINELNANHENNSKSLQNQIDVVQGKINDTINSWNNDKKGIVAFFARYVEKIDKYVNVVLNDADQDSPAYMEISQMADSMNGYLAFKDKALEIISQDLPINEIESQISSLILNDLKYEKSWFNTIARLYAYSQVSDLHTAFGYYDTIAEDMKALFRAMENLSEVFAVTEIVVPELFKDEFTSKKYDYKNTNLVLPQIYPTYAEILNPMAIYDFSIVGYTYDGVTNKPVVAYNTKS